MENTKVSYKDEKARWVEIPHVHGNPRQAVLYSYIAGIIDGEGSIRINKSFTPRTIAVHRVKSPVYNAQINLGMVDKEIPDLLKDTFGGNVREERVPGMRSIWRYSLTGRNQLIDVLNNLLPYLRIKRKHAEVVIDFCQNWKTPHIRRNGTDPQEILRREDAFQEIRKLNLVGAAAEAKQEDIREDEAMVRSASKDVEGNLKGCPATSNLSGQ